MADAWTQRYLRVLDVEPEPPSLPALGRLTRAHVERVVFENVTAILRRARTGRGGPVPPVDSEAVLAAIERQAGGGVCFDLATTFRELLARLGYQVQPLLAQISFPGSHHATLVGLEGAQYLVDVGGGWPLWHPIRIGETVEIEHVGLGFRIYPGEPGVYLRATPIDGEWTVGCSYDLSPADDAARDAAYQRHQVAGATWVVGNLTMVTSTRDGVHRIRDDELVSYTPAGKSTRKLTTDVEFAETAADQFGLPNLPVNEARAYLAAIKQTATVA